MSEIYFQHASSFQIQSYTVEKKTPVVSNLNSDNKVHKCQELWGESGDFIGISSNLSKQEDVKRGMGSKREDELGSFRTNSSVFIGCP